MTTPRRFNWLFSWRRAYLWVLYVAVFPAYSGVASIPAFHLSLSNTSDWASVLLIAVGKLPPLLHCLCGGHAGQLKEAGL